MIYLNFYSAQYYDVRWVNTTESVNEGNQPCGHALYFGTVYMHASPSVVSASLQPHGLQLARFLCPWDSPGKNIRASCNFLPQEIFLTQGSNLHLLPWQANSLPLSHLGSRILGLMKLKYMYEFYLDRNYKKHH